MRIKELSILSVLAIAVSAQVSANTMPGMPKNNMLTGDEKTACEVILCLSDPKAARDTKECHPPIEQFYRIKAKKWKDTVKKRKNFLKKCPDAEEQHIDNAVNQKNIVDCNSPIKSIALRQECKKNNTAFIVNNDEQTKPGEDLYEDEPEIKPTQNVNNQDVEDSTGAYWKKKKGGITVSFTQRYFIWGGDQNLEPGKTYTVVYYTDAGEGKSVKNTVDLKAKDGGIGLYLKNALIKEGAPILVYNGGTLVDTYHKNGNTGRIIYDVKPKTVEINGATWVE